MNLVNDIPITEDDYKHINCIVEIPLAPKVKVGFPDLSLIASRAL